MRELTRKAALLEAIELVKRSDLPRELRERHFPKELLDGQNRDAVVETFRKEYKRCKASTLKGYDKNRGVGQPCAQTVMKAAGVSRWSDLLNRAGVETVREQQKRLGITKDIRPAFSA